MAIKDVKHTSTTSSILVLFLAKRYNSLENFLGNWDDGAVNTIRLCLAIMSSISSLSKSTNPDQNVELGSTKHNNCFSRIKQPVKTLWLESPIW